MSTFKAFLMEDERRTQFITEERAVEHAKHYCKKYVQLYDIPVVWRGIFRFFGPDGDRASYGYVEPTKGVRKSRNTQNYYTWLIDNSPRWAEYPKRSEGLICSTSFNTANSFGRGFAVVPEDNAKFGVSPGADFWISFKNVVLKNLGGDMASLNDNISDILYSMGREQHPDTAEDFFHSMELISDHALELKKGEAVHPTVRKNLEALVKGNDLFAYLYKHLSEKRDIRTMMDAVLAPTTNKFHIVDVQGLQQIRNKNLEIWTNSASLYVDPGAYREFRSMVLDTHGSDNLKQPTSSSGNQSQQPISAATPTSAQRSLKQTLSV